LKRIKLGVPQLCRQVKKLWDVSGCSQYSTILMDQSEGTKLDWLKKDSLRPMT